ncbi:hypothetical protein PAXRUDRAFT_826520 [Paxillus rubicundulus Ve08.2h10]|uniref:Uncharacterized protein n=1 Tax=Paxillus rubicundulus Ve08.2h10 TaxID=930991 RepID=A0A0D0DZG8_9AGAM|nr:hypothetical protein PAXRUDRAFT_826520 [Paxillus rubicundulus Ve08.2h10]
MSSAFCMVDSRVASYVPGTILHHFLCLSHHVHALLLSLIASSPRQCCSSLGTLSFRPRSQSTHRH